MDTLNRYCKRIVFRDTRCTSLRLPSINPHPTSGDPQLTHDFDLHCCIPAACTILDLFLRNKCMVWTSEAPEAYTKNRKNNYTPRFHNFMCTPLVVRSTLLRSLVATSAEHFALKSPLGQSVAERHPSIQIWFTI